MNDLITAHFPFHEIKELNIIFLTVYILDDMKPVFDICLKSNALYILCMYACSILACRGVGSYLKLGGQVVGWWAQSAPSGWYRVNWSAKTWVGNCRHYPPISYVPGSHTVHINEDVFVSSLQIRVKVNPIRMKE